MSIIDSIQYENGNIVVGDNKRTEYKPFRPRESELLEIMSNAEKIAIKDSKPSIKITDNTTDNFYFYIEKYENDEFKVGRHVLFSGNYSQTNKYLHSDITRNDKTADLTSHINFDFRDNSPLSDRVFSFERIGLKTNTSKSSFLNFMEPLRELDSDGSYVIDETIFKHYKKFIRDTIFDVLLHEEY